MSKKVEIKSASERKLIIRAAVWAVLLLLLDQVTKWYFVLAFELHESRDIIPGVLSFTSVRNPGAAWSMLSGYSWVLMLIGLAAAIVLVWFFRAIAEAWRERYYALAIVLSGIIGNTLDRFYHGVVVDFIHVHWYNVWHYPVFNVADMAICCGVCVLFLSVFFRKSDPEPGKAE
jgi:signal peptidase II